MLSCVKGTISELTVQKSLLGFGYNVYLPLCDTGVDMICQLSNGGISRVQVKSVHVLKGTSVEVNVEKYVNKDRVDVVAIVIGSEIVESAGMIAYVPYEDQHSINLALQTAKNNQNKGRNWFYQYSRFPEFS